MILIYSGIFSILITWSLVVAPSIIGGIKSDHKTIFQVTVKKKYLYIISAGLVTGAVFQLLFLINLTNKFRLSITSPGVILYFSTIISTLFVVMFPYFKHKNVHTWLVVYYFIAIPISLILIGFQVKTANYVLFLASMATPLLYFLGEIFFAKKYQRGNALTEIWAFSLLSIWTLLMTFL